MNDPFDSALAVIASLNRHSVDYVVIGGVALNVHGLLRATEDLDIFVRPDAANIARLREALRGVWSDPEIEGIKSEDLCGEYPAVRYGPPQGTLYLDIVTRLGSAFAFEDVEAETRRVGEVDVRVATARMLYHMKRDTVRERDRADAEALRAAFGLDEER